MEDEIEFQVSILEDEEGFTGRECPECEGYFKIEFGTGLPDATEAICPYCGYKDDHDQFFTSDQIEYIESVVINQISDEIEGIFKEVEYDGDFINIEFEGNTHPLHKYKEKKLETDVVCDNCSLRYEIYGAFSYCPDCGIHNSFQIFKRSLETTTKLFDVELPEDKEVKRRILENALEDVVSSFDGFGREMCKEYSTLSSDPELANNISFQSLNNARDKVLNLFDFDIIDNLRQNQWRFLCEIFQKRHLISHNMGVVDKHYIRETEDDNAEVGKKISLDPSEVEKAIDMIEKLGKDIFEQFQNMDSN